MNEMKCNRIHSVPTARRSDCDEDDPLTESFSCKFNYVEIVRTSTSTCGKLAKIELSGECLLKGEWVKEIELNDDQNQLKPMSTVCDTKLNVCPSSDKKFVMLLMWNNDDYEF